MIGDADGVVKVKRSPITVQLVTGVGTTKLPGEDCLLFLDSAGGAIGLSENRFVPLPYTPSTLLTKDIDIASTGCWV